MKFFIGLAGFVLCAAAVRGADVADLIKQLQTGDNDARRAAAKSLGEGGAGSKEAVPALIKALRDRDTYVRRFSAQALGDIGLEAKSAVPALATMLDDPKKNVQLAAANALGKLGPDGIAKLIDILRDENRDAATRSQAVHTLGELGSAAHSAVPTLTDLLKGKGGKKKGLPLELRTDAAVALGSIAKSSDTATVAALTALTEKKAKTPRGLRQAANQALRKINRKK